MPPYKTTFDAIGTKWRIETLDRLSESLLIDIHDCIERYDQTYSRFRTDSLVTAMTKRLGTYDFTDDSVELIEFYRSLYDATDGKVTPLIGSMLEQAGYDSTYSFRAQPLVAVPSWDAAMRWNGASVTTTQPIVLDIGAAGKGQLIDKIAELLNANDLSDYVIDASGDLIHKGASENIVGLEHPYDVSKIIGTVSVQNASLCASATNRRTWGNSMHHILDPSTMKPVRGTAATWVIASDAMTADGLATALFFTEPKKLQDHFDFEYVRMHRNGSIDHSIGFNGEIFT